MEKIKFAGCIPHRAFPEKIGMALLWLLCSTAAVLFQVGTSAYAGDPGAVSSQQEQSFIVTNWKGEYLGTTSRVLMDPTAGTIVFVIVSFEMEQNKIKKIAIPYDLFSVDTKNGMLVLGTGRKKLDAAPEYKPSDLEDPEFIGRTNRFFAVAPPWKNQDRRDRSMTL